MQMRGALLRGKAALPTAVATANQYHNYHPTYAYVHTHGHKLDSPSTSSHAHVHVPTTQPPLSSTLNASGTTLSPFQAQLEEYRQRAALAGNLPPSPPSPSPLVLLMIANCPVVWCTAASAATLPATASSTAPATSTSAATATATTSTPQTIRLLTPHPVVSLPFRSRMHYALPPLLPSPSLPPSLPLSFLPFLRVLNRMVRCVYSRQKG
jgi:hypothetical protein